MAQKIRIALSLLSGISYGGVTYFRNLIPALAKMDKINEYHIFVPANHPLLKNIKQDNFIFHECSLNIRLPFARFFWEQCILPNVARKIKIDVIFTAKNANILLAPCKTITSIRNTEPLCYQHYKNDWKLNIFSWMRRVMTVISVRKSDRVVAVSYAVKQRLEKLFPSVNDKIDVVYNGNPVPKDFLISSEAIGKPYLLCVSKFVAYANQLNLIKGYSRLFSKGKDIPELWFAGGILDYKYFREIKKFIEENNLKEKIVFLGLVPHSHLLGLYTGATAFVFPSTLESCPQTLIEAMAFGIPIATSCIAPMPEICQEAAVYFSPFNPEDIANKIESVIFDEKTRSTLRNNSSKRCKFFDWNKTAQELISIFQKTVQ